MQLAICLPKTTEIDKLLTDKGADILRYDQQWKQYRLKLKKSDLATMDTLLKELMKKAYQLKQKQ
jgi:hypothetical protein